MTDIPDYVVVRAAPDLAPGFLPRGLDGTWFDRSTMACGSLSETVAVPTGRFETRDDGAVAEVYEVQP